MKSWIIGIVIALASVLTPFAAAQARGDGHWGGFHHGGDGWAHDGGWHARGGRDWGGDWGGAAAAGLLGYLVGRSIWSPVPAYSYYPAPVPDYSVYQSTYVYYPSQFAPPGSLPPGYAYDSEGRVVRPDGEYARDQYGQILRVQIPGAPVSK